MGTSVHKRITLSVGAILALVVAACGSATPPAATSTPTAAAASAAPSAAPATPRTPVTIKWMTFWNTGGRDALGDPLIKAFEAKNPHIKVELISVPFGQFKDKALAMNVAKSAPDVISPQPNMISPFLDGGLLRPLDDLLAADPAYKAQLPQGALLPVRGKQYFVPVALAPTGMFFNKDLLAAAGVQIPSTWTWDDILAAAKKVTDKSKGKYATAFGLCQKESTNVATQLFPFMYQGGGDLLDPAGRANLTHPGTLAGAKFYLDLIRGGYTVPGTNNMCFSDIIGNFTSGVTAFHFQNSAGKGAIVGQNPKLNFGFTIPQGPAGKEAVLRYTSWTLGISTQSAHPKEAFEFIKFMTTEHNSTIARTGGLIPANANSAKESWVMTDPVASVASAAIQGNPKASLTDVMLPNSDKMYTDLTIAMQAVVAGEQTLEAAMAKVNDQWNAALGKK